MTHTDARPWRVWTWPNALSALRLLGVPVFLWLVIVERADVLAFVVLVLASITDWLDGALARALGQYSRLGTVLDPLADRCYIAATLVGLAIRGIIPWWLVAVLIARELMLLALLPLLRRRGLVPSRDPGRQGSDVLPAVGLPVPAARLGTRAPGHARMDLRLGVQHLGHVPLLVGRAGLCPHRS